MPPKKSKAIWRHFYGEKSQRLLRQQIRQIYSLNEDFVELVCTSLNLSINYMRCFVKCFFA